MTPDRSLTTTPARRRGEIAVGFLDTFDKRIVNIRDQDRLATFNVVLAELYGCYDSYGTLAQYHYLSRILSDITYFSSRQHPGPRRVSTAAPMRGDSRQLKLRYALLHYGTMHRIARRTGAQLCDTYRDFYRHRAYMYADTVIDLAPSSQRADQIKWVRDIVAETPHLSQQAVDDLVAQVAARHQHEAPSVKFDWLPLLRNRLVRHKKSP